MPIRKRCPICASKKWHKEPQSGLIICSEGHVLENYRNETNETTELGPHARKKRTIKSSKKGKAAADRSDPHIYYGGRATYHYFQCLQLLLRQQIAVLSETWNLPPEFENVCRDIWALHLSLLPDVPPPEPFLFATGTGEKNKSGREKSGDGASGEESGSSSGSSESSEDEDDENERTLARMMREASIAGDEHDGIPHIPQPIASSSKKNKRHEFDTPASTIAVLVIGCWLLRVPVMYMDFVRLIERYTLPYLDPCRNFPQEMTRHLSKYTRTLLSPRWPPNPLAIHKLVSRLARLMYAKYEIKIPEVNGAPMMWRAARAMSGTATLYVQAKALAQTLSLPLTLHFTLGPSLDNEKENGPRWHADDNVPVEVSLVAVVIIVLKMTHGYDGTERYGDLGCAMAEREAYIAELKKQVVDGTRTEEAVLSGRSERPVNEWHPAEIDAYLQMCEVGLLGDESARRTGKARSIADECTHSIDPGFDLVSAYFGGEAGDGHVQAEGSSRQISPLPATGLPDEATGIEPGSWHSVYNTQDILGEVPDEYGTVLAVGARWAGVSVEEVSRVVERFERRLSSRE
ncbi:hypothetical protein SISNIDRAFT_405751 [Sistotremastrum niveocremeum HHB9708]|uniref:RRN7-type domain-containing protein n=1 Tax=Sistotremastrum niveocremeum HHB9708 TaxID=1314777 RepID=A0A164ZQW1_9AGAM|nr:hypothetical protein SISNIDRAFT_405751 [Sistotremastrum niveocremeum HHB9708]